MQAGGKLFERCVRDIDRAYKQLNHTLGWRFLSVPKCTLQGDIEIALVTLNPGGAHKPVNHAEASSEAGSAYAIESWDGNPPGEARLQRQLLALLLGLHRETNHLSTFSDLLNRGVLCGHFVPFRSPSFEALPRRLESLDFAMKLWSQILRECLPRVIITIDQRAFRGLLRVIADGLNGECVAQEFLPTGWGQYHAQIARMEVPHRPTIYIGRLPHLSRFTLFGREASEGHMSHFLRMLTQR